MTSKNNDSGNVKWPHFITSVIGMIIIIIAYGVSKGEFSQFEKRMDDKVSHFEKRMDDKFNMVLIAIKDLKK